MGIVKALGAGEEFLDRFELLGLIVLDRQHIVGFALNDLRGNGALVTHGIDTDQRPFEH